MFEFDALADILRLDDTVVSFAPRENMRATFDATIQMVDQRPVEILINNSINDAMLLMFAFVDVERLGAAIAATNKVQVVGLCTVGEDAFALRYGIFIEHSDMHAVTNGYRALALAHNFYLDGCATQEPEGDDAAARAAISNAITHRMRGSDYGYRN